MIDSGFNLISLANNHSLDKGVVGINNSTQFWDDKQVIYSGTERELNSRIKTFTQKGIKFAFVAYTYGANGLIIPENKEYLVNLYDQTKVKEDIQSVREHVDVIIVSMHWGSEYLDLPNDNQIEQANDLARFGVDIIIGHHPHVIQPFDIIKYNEHETYVCYSLGNFLSDQRGIDRLIGMAFSINIEKNNNEIMIKEPEARLIYTHKNDKNEFKLRFLSDIAQSILPNKNDLLNEKTRLIKIFESSIEVI